MLYKLKSPAKIICIIVIRNFWNPYFCNSFQHFQVFMC
nr:MAG TPA: hypothetical protein [Caudoviricetes sp.]